MKFIVPFKTISIIASNALVESLSVGLIKFPAALLTRQSTLPNSSKDFLITLFTSSIFLTSHAKGRMFPFFELVISFATLVSKFSLLLVIIISGEGEMKFYCK